MPAPGNWWLLMARPFPNCILVGDEIEIRVPAEGDHTAWGIAVSLRGEFSVVGPPPIWPHPLATSYARHGMRGRVISVANGPDVFFREDHLPVPGVEIEIQIQPMTDR